MGSKARIGSAAVATLLGLCVSVSATILRVPSEYPTIQAGINAAIGGDTVLVADGTYTGDGNRDIDFWSKAVVLTSENGPESTIIDCEGSSSDPHRGFYFHSMESPGSVVRGFTITNGYAMGGSPYWPENCGGGVLCRSSSSPTISGNIITQNTTEWAGGGIYCSGSSNAIIVGNTITANTALSGGGGIACAWSSPSIIDNTITENTAESRGAGIDCWEGSHPLIRGNTIEGNSTTSSDSQGGGIHCYIETSPFIAGNRIAANIAQIGGGIFINDHTSPTVRGNLFTQNTACEWGGGIYIDEHCTGSIIENTITENTAPDGGGIYLKRWTDPIIGSNIIMRNTADRGGGIFCTSGTAIITENTITENDASQGGGICFWDCGLGLPPVEGSTITKNTASEGGGIYCYVTDPIVMNCILWADSATIGREIFRDIQSSPDVTYCNIEGGWAGEGNIDAEPMFVLAGERDYRLLWESPCIDAGHPDSLDPDGTRADMGAHFFDQDDFLTLYLSPDTTLVSPGEQLQVFYTVINRWNDPQQFWAAAGVLVPGGDTLLIMGPDRYTIPGDYTAQVPVAHAVPAAAPPGDYVYVSVIGFPPAALYDQDDFSLSVAGP